MKIVGKVFAILYTFMFTLILFGFTLVFTTSSYLSDEFFADLVSSEVFMETDLTKLELEFDGKEEMLELCGDSCTVKDIIIATANKNLGISEELIEEALEDKDIQSALGSFTSVYIKSTVTEKVEKIYYEDYEDILEKEVVKDILAELEYTNDDIKRLIDEFNNGFDSNNYSEVGGVYVEQHEN